MSDDYLRLLSAQVHSLLQIQVAREMFGKSLFALGTGEVTAVYTAVANLETGNTQFLTPELVRQLAMTPQQQQEALKQRNSPGFVQATDKAEKKE